MAKMSWFQKVYWRNLAKPVANRALFRHLLDHPIGSVLEIGVGDGIRLKQILSLYTLKSDAKQLRYAAVDLFESGPREAGHLKLKDVHRMLAERNIKAILVPGDAVNGLPRLVQTVMPSDLVVVNEGWQSNSAVGNALKQWLPRMVHEGTAVFARTGPDDAFTPAKIESIQTGLSRAA